MVYAGFPPTDSVLRIFKVSTDGGSHVELAKDNVFGAVVSPDGTSPVYRRVEGQGASATLKLIVQPVASDAPILKLKCLLRRTF